MLPSFSAPSGKLDTATLRGLSEDENTFFVTLEGIVNRKQPRLYFDSPQNAEGATTWLDSVGQHYNPPVSAWSLVPKYLREVSGIVVYDTSNATQLHTRNVATTIAGVKSAVAVGPSLVAKLTGAPYNLPILEDLRGRFTTPVQMYNYLYSAYWSQATHGTLMGLSPTITGELRDYAVALNVAVVWLDPANPDERAALEPFLKDLPAGKSVYLGWWPVEQSGVAMASQYGVATVASDHLTNASILAAVPSSDVAPAIPPLPPLQNKIYVSLILSDGDNVQYMQHAMRLLWNDPNRGKVPLGWTVSPSSRDLAPGLFGYYARTATPNDALISGPSGYAYCYPNDFPLGVLETFANVSASYLDSLNLRVITVWNTVHGSITRDTGEIYARQMPRVLGITTQAGIAGITNYSGMLPSKTLDAYYSGSEQDLLNAINSASAGWNGTHPLFLAVQAVAWNVNVSNLLDLANHLDANHVVVRPDHLFQLYRQQSGLPIDGNSAPDIHQLSFDFTRDLQGWVPYTNHGDYDRALWTGQIGNPAGSLLLDGSDLGQPNGLVNSWFQRLIRLPTTTDALEFETRSDDLTHGGQLRVRLVDSAGASYTLMDWELTRSVTFVKKHVDLSRFAGQDVTLFFEQNDSGAGSGEYRYIDNVNILTHPAPVADAGTPGGIITGGTDAGTPGETTDGGTSATHTPPSTGCTAAAGPAGWLAVALLAALNSVRRSRRSMD